MIRSGVTRIPSRRRGVGRLIALALGLGLAAASIVGPATAASAAVVTKDILAGPLVPTATHNGVGQFEYGAEAPASRRLYLSARTRTIKLESPRFIAPHPGIQHLVICYAYDAAGKSIIGDRVMSTTGFPAGVVRLNVKLGSVSLLNDRAYTVYCQIEGVSADATVGAFADLTWHMTTKLSVGSVVSLTEDPTKLLRSHTAQIWLGFSHDGTPVAPGDRVRVISEPGFWRPAGVTPGLTTAHLRGHNTEVFASNVAVSADGSILSFDVPPFAPLVDTEAIVSSNWTIAAGTATTPRRTAAVHWFGGVDVVGAH